MNTSGCPERRLFAIVASKNPELPAGPEMEKFRRRLEESKTRPETEELLANCICNPSIVAVIVVVRTVETELDTVTVETVLVRAVSVEVELESVLTEVELDVDVDADVVVDVEVDVEVDVNVEDVCATVVNM
jgi:hypothetical protein